MLDTGRLLSLVAVVLFLKNVCIMGSFCSTPFFSEVFSSTCDFSIAKNYIECFISD